jgi:hypothetical protein
LDPVIWILQGLGIIFFTHENLLFSINQQVKENLTSEVSTTMNPTAKATTMACTANHSKSGSATSNEGKQKEGEKQVFWYGCIH